MKSQRTFNQEKIFGPKPISGYGHGAQIKARVCFDDSCRNGHNTFSITGEIYIVGRRDIEAGGCLHDEIAKHFPSLAPLLKWHLVSTDEPLHYVANTLYHVECSKLDDARSSAVWPDATDDELKAPDLKARLQARLPKLLEEFRAAVESLGFTW